MLTPAKHANGSARGMKRSACIVASPAAPNSNLRSIDQPSNLLQRSVNVSDAGGGTTDVAGETPHPAIRTKSGEMLAFHQEPRITETGAATVSALKIRAKASSMLSFLRITPPGTK
jgi:hypothetical protein